MLIRKYNFYVTAKEKGTEKYDALLWWLIVSLCSLFLTNSSSHSFQLINHLSPSYCLPLYPFHFLLSSLTRFLFHVTPFSLLLLQSVLSGSGGGGVCLRRSRCVRGAARTFIRLPLTAATLPRAACVGRGFTETLRVCVSSPPSAPAMTRACCGRYAYTHKNTHTHTHWLTPKQDICCPANLVACPYCAWIIVAFIWILPLACCLRPLPSPPLCYLLIKKGLLEDEWHAPRATLHHNAFSLINYKGSTVERRHSGHNLAGLPGIIYYGGDIIGL